MIRALCIAVLLCMVQCATAQVYVDHATRHRFAQLTLGGDMQLGFGGQTKFLNRLGKTESLDFPTGFRPRILIGGTHFWGHADFYIAIPILETDFSHHRQRVVSLRGVETVFKYYPMQILDRKLRPFVGISLAPGNHRQDNVHLGNGTGPTEHFVRVPLHAGASFNRGRHLLELALVWNYHNRLEYSISPQIRETITTPPLFASVSYRLMLETTLGAEADWESGRTAEITDLLAERGDLDGYYLGVGLSSAFWLEKSGYNTKHRPYLGGYGISLTPDFALGYHLHHPDMNFALGYRMYRESPEAYGVKQEVSRKSVLFEAVKMLFDYHGFVPFAGTSVSYEQLEFSESVGGVEVVNVRDQRLAYGFTFGWDIRPNRLQKWILRTHVRWYPRLLLDVGSHETISFQSLEFNFIQLVVYPNRF